MLLLAERERQARAKTVSSKTCSRMRHRTHQRGSTALSDREDLGDETEQRRQRGGQPHGSGESMGESGGEMEGSDWPEGEPG